MFKRTSSCIALWALALVCVASFSLMFVASRGDSAIDDELAHIPAGYGYVHNLDYRLNPEHPPLVKALAMLPVLFLNPTFPTTSDAWKNQVNAEWTMGTQFLYQSGNNAMAIIDLARIFPMLLTLLLVLYIYLLARGLMGNWWALLPATLFAFSPTVLANGHYVTTDVGAAFGVVFASYYFLKFIDAPSKKHLLYASLAFGVAQITKFSAPFLIPVDVLAVIILWLRTVITTRRETPHPWKTFFLKLWRRLWPVIAMFAIGYIVIVYPTYLLFTARYPIQKQVADTQTILASFANGPTPAGQMCEPIRCVANLDITMSKNPVLRPFAEYLLGLLMVLQRADAGNTIYFLGHVVGSGGWAYFPLLFLLKETIPTLIIVLGALFLALFWMFRRDRRDGRGRWQRILDYIGVNFAEFFMASFVLFYWAYSIHSPLNIGLRYVLPTFPFIYILAAGVWKKWITNITVPPGGLTIASLGATARSFFRSMLKYLLLIALVVWLILEAVFAAPYFLSYFNEFGGGVWNGYHYVTDSNYDWGQDLGRLQTWMVAHPEVDKIAVDYFGGGDPHYYLGAKEVDWSSSKGSPADQGIHWLAVSVNTLEGATQPLGKDQTRNLVDSYSWLTELRPPAPGMGDLPPPDFRAGTSIFIYHL